MGGVVCIYAYLSAFMCEREKLVNVSVKFLLKFTLFILHELPVSKHSFLRRSQFSAISKQTNSC